MICQWCKDTGDGMHDYDDCKKPREFRVQLFKNINRAYDEIKWCWHCSSTNHTTRACTATPSEQDRARWNGAISDIIGQWQRYDYSYYESRFREGDDDAAMVTAMASHRPPEPVDYKWCIVCEEFGHLAQNDSTTCKRAEYERRCPPQFRNQAIAARQPFMPTTFNNGVTNRTNDVNYFRPAPESKDVTVQALEVIASIWSHASDFIGRRFSESIFKAIENPYLKRPSTALSKKVAVHRWPDKQPAYEDKTSLLGKAEVFKNNGSYFNELGNHQTYFPAARFHITEEMIEVSMNDGLAINKAGRMGLRMYCLTCRTAVMTLDDEGDVVMCGNDGTCTLGCGAGYLHFVNDYGVRILKCRCLTVCGDVPDLRWLRR